MTAPTLLTRIAAAGLIAGGFWLVGTWAGGAMNAALSRTRVEPTLRVAVARAALPLLFGLGLLVALSALGLDTRPLLIVLASLGLGLGLALRGPFAALLGGVGLILSRPFAAGQTIQVDGVEGRVCQLDLLSTTVETAEGDRISLRNDRVWRGPLRVRAAQAPTPEPPPAPVGPDDATSTS